MDKNSNDAKKREIEIARRYMDLIKFDKNWFTYKTGYTFGRCGQVSREEFERRCSWFECRDEYAAVFHCMAQLYYFTLPMLKKRMLEFKAEKVLPLVVTKETYIESLLFDLIDLGAVVKLPFQPKDKKEAAMVKSPLSVFCLTGRGAQFFKDKTMYRGYIEEYAINKTAPEIFMRLSVNYVLTEFAPYIRKSGFKTKYCRFERTNNEVKGSERQPVHGTVESDKHFVVFEGISYDKDVAWTTEECTMSYIQKRAQYLDDFYSNISSDRQKIIVFVIDDKDNIKRVWRDYSYVISRCDVIYFTSDSLIRNAADGVAPFLQVWEPQKSAEKADTGEINLLTRAEAPVFLSAAVKKTEKKI